MKSTAMPLMVFVPQSCKFYMKKPSHYETKTTAHELHPIRHLKALIIFYDWYMFAQLCLNYETHFDPTLQGFIKGDAVKAASNHGRNTLDKVPRKCHSNC